jgi:tRNA A-37 threonylcarbamoyl transferase component Bud32
MMQKLPMEKISPQEYQSWLDAHTLVEKDRRGPKVLQCKNGDYIKLFRIKHRVSRARLLNPARQFCRNAQRIAALGIPTLKPLALYHIPHVDRWAVRYTPLTGDTLRGLIQQGALPETVIAQFGVFIAQLHEKGVYFRSLHPGNVVLTPEGSLGLIDILDCYFSWFGKPLLAAQCARNFRHLFRYDDAQLLRESLMAAYQKAHQ